jgi:hypothetical protein
VLELDSLPVRSFPVEDLDVPLVDLGGFEFPHARLKLGDTVYSYRQTFPVMGHSAVMPQHLRGLIEEGHRVLLAQRGERYYVYVA